MSKLQSKILLGTESIPELEAKMKEVMAEISLNKQRKLIKLKDTNPDYDKDLKEHPKLAIHHMGITTLTQTGLLQIFSADMDRLNESLGIFDLYIDCLNSEFNEPVTCKQKFDAAIYQYRIGIAYLCKCVPTKQLLDTLLTKQNCKEDIKRKAIAHDLLQCELKLNKTQIEFGMRTREISTDGIFEKIFSNPADSDNEEEEEEYISLSVLQVFNKEFAEAKISEQKLLAISSKEEVESYVQGISANALKVQEEKDKACPAMGFNENVRSTFQRCMKNPLEMFWYYLGIKVTFDKESGPISNREVTLCKIGILYLQYQGISLQTICENCLDIGSEEEVEDHSIKLKIITRALLQSGISSQSIEKTLSKLKKPDTEGEKYMSTNHHSFVMNIGSSSASSSSSSSSSSSLSNS